MSRLAYDPGNSSSAFRMLDGASASRVPDGTLEIMAKEQAMTILNLTQHASSPEQISGGVVEPADKRAVGTLLTFDVAPDGAEMERRAGALAAMAAAAGASAAMIGGAPYFMGPLEKALRGVGVTPLYSFSTRSSVDQPQPDGSVKKVAVFRHTGWVEGIS